MVFCYYNRQQGLRDLWPWRLYCSNPGCNRGPEGNLNAIHNYLGKLCMHVYLLKLLKLFILWGPPPCGHNNICIYYSACTIFSAVGYVLFKDSKHGEYTKKFLIMVFRLHTLHLYRPEIGQVARKGDTSLKGEKKLEIDFKDIAKVGYASIASWRNIVFYLLCRWTLHQ